jgi:alpha-amylase
MTHVLKRAALLLLTCLAIGGCRAEPAPDGSQPTEGLPSDGATDASTFWNSATIYFLLTDRFENANPDNDGAGRPSDAAVLRGFLGGDLAGVRRRLDEGYFDELGVTAIWMTPFFEQIRGSVDEGTGTSYGYHGYWMRDWTAVEPAIGTTEDLAGLVRAAHERGIRVLMDAVINHTGPPTELDPQWPDEWVRMEPTCVFSDYTTTVDCVLVDNLADIRTARDEPVDLPPSLVRKWTNEGRLEQEVAELDAFFERTGHPRAPRYYLIKWLTDWVRELGIDGYRVDTTKHFEERVSVELRAEADHAFEEWKSRNPSLVLDDQPFYMMGEVYNYFMSAGREFDFGDRTVDFFDHGYDGLINFDFKGAARGPLEALFSRYSATLREGELRGVSIVNYVSSHDDPEPYDRERQDPFGAGTRLLLAPGAAQIYYGDELARTLVVDGARGDANLRSPMNWGDAEERSDLLSHWRKLGRFRRDHPSVGAGAHRLLQEDPYVFSRSLERDGLSDRVVVALGGEIGPKRIPVSDVFTDGTDLVDAYSGVSVTVEGGQAELTTDFEIVLLAERR